MLSVAFLIFVVNVIMLSVVMLNVIALTYETKLERLARERHSSLLLIPLLTK